MHIILETGSDEWKTICATTLEIMNGPLKPLIARMCVETMKARHPNVNEVYLDGYYYGMATAIQFIEKGIIELHSLKIEYPKPEGKESEAPDGD